MRFGGEVLLMELSPLTPRIPLEVPMGLKSGRGVVGVLMAPFLTKPSMEDSNAPESFPFIGTDPCPTTTGIFPLPIPFIPPFIAIAESLNPPKLLTSRAPVEPCSVVRRLCSPEKSVKVRTLVGVAGRDWGIRRMSETEDSALGDGGIGGRFVGDGERFGGCEYTPVCSCRKE